MSSSISTRVLAALAAVLVPTTIQAQSPQAIIGGAASGTPFLQRQVHCNPATSLCGPILSVPTNAWAGGTAYDPARQIIWDTDGVSLTGVRALSTPPCAVVCPSGPVPGLPATGFATGLAFDDATRRLYVLTSTPEIITLTTPPTTACPVFQSQCSLTGVFPATHRPGGLAYSEKHRALFYSVSDFSGGPANSVVFIASAANVCMPLCKFQPLNCPGFVLGPITGLAYDDGRNILYLTDGKVIQRLVIVPGGNCQPQLVDCCTAPVLAPYYGLELEPSHATATGSSCTSAPCPACAAMTFGALGDPVVGNTSFALSLTNAPASGILLAYLGVGGCTAGVPVICGLFHPSLAPIYLGNAPLSGTPACNGSATFPLPIPNAYFLIGLDLCVQGLVVCTPGFGFGLTNALGLRITDN
jgi:hypothetical protein